MKYFIFSDLHGNQHVLNQLKKAVTYYQPDSILFLGDVFGYYYGFKACIEFLEEINSICIMGNHDLYAQKILNGDNNLLERVLDKYGNGYNKLFEERKFYLEYLNNLKSSHSVIVNNKRIFFVHGSTIDNLEGRIYPDTNLSIEDFKDHDIIFSGHTHHKCIKYVNGKLWVNVGSSGQPRDGQLPSFVIYNNENGSILFNSIELDWKLIKNDLIQHGDFGSQYSNILNRKPCYE